MFVVPLWFFLRMLEIQKHEDLLDPWFSRGGLEVGSKFGPKGSKRSGCQGVRSVHGAPASFEHSFRRLR